MLETDFDSFVDKDKAVKETENIHLLKRIAEPDEIADFILFAASSKGRFMTGQYYRIDGGIGIEIGGI